MPRSKKFCTTEMGHGMNSNEWYASTCRINYHTVWITAQCEKNIVNYYRRCFQHLYHTKVQPPRFGSHVSIVRGEEEDIEAGLWKKNPTGERISFQYGPMKWNDEYIWLPVRSPEFEILRTKYGLSKDPPIPFHLTIGKLGEKRKIDSQDKDQIVKIINGSLLDTISIHGPVNESNTFSVAKRIAGQLLGHEMLRLNKEK